MDLLLDEQPVEKDVRYAGFWIRVVAIIIDSIVLFIIGLLLKFIISGHVLSQIIGVLIGLLYFVLMETSEKQGTLGKMILNIKVTNLNFEKISYSEAIVRYIIKNLGGYIVTVGTLTAGGAELLSGDYSDILSLYQNILPFTSIGGLVSIIVYVSVAFHNKKQGIHDRIAKTYVIEGN